jgi:hypothetical protein
MGFGLIGRTASDVVEKHVGVQAEEFHRRFPRVNRYWIALAARFANISFNRPSASVVSCAATFENEEV